MPSKKNYFQTTKGDAGIKNRLLDVAAEGQKVAQTTGVPLFSGEGAANFALSKYDSRVRAKLRSLGLQVPETGPLTVMQLRDGLRDKTGLEFEELTADSISSALDKQIAKQLSAKLGFEVTTVFDAAALKGQVKAAIVEKLKDGTALGLIKGASLTALRRAATFAKAGIDPVQAKKIQNQRRQKKYRRNHELVWVN